MPPREPAPPEIHALAEQRALARRDRDWATADHLKSEIEAAGWKVVDAGLGWSLEPGRAATVEHDGVTRYGRSDAVPSRLDEVATARVTVVVVVGEPGSASDPAPDAPVASRLAGLRSLASSAPDGTQVIVVANDVPASVESALADLDRVDPGAPGVATELVRTSGPLGAAAARNAGIRRATGPVIILADPDVANLGALVAPLAAALDDPTIAVAGTLGLITDDLRRFRTVSAGATPTAVDGRCIAFRREDFRTLGPLDEGFTSAAFLDAWWSLVLRDGTSSGEWQVALDTWEAAGGVGVPPAMPAHRRAVLIAGDGEPHPGPTDAGAASADDARTVRRQRYRFLKHFATRRDLIEHP